MRVVLKIDDSKERALAAAAFARQCHCPHNAKANAQNGATSVAPTLWLGRQGQSPAVVNGASKKNRAGVLSEQLKLHRQRTC